MDKSTYLNVKTHDKIVTCLSIRAEASKLPIFFCLENLTYRCCKFWYYLDISQVDYTQIIWPYAHTNPEITKVFFPFLLYLICSSSSSSPNGSTNTLMLPVWKLRPREWAILTVIQKVCSHPHGKHICS